MSRSLERTERLRSCRRVQRSREAGFLALLALLLIGAPPASAQVEGGPVLLIPRPQGPASVMWALSYGLSDYQASDVHTVTARVAWDANSRASRSGLIAGGGVILPKADSVDTGFTVGVAYARQWADSRGLFWPPGLRTMVGVSHTRLTGSSATWRQWDAPLALGATWQFPVVGTHASLGAAGRGQLRVAEATSSADDAEASIGGGASLTLALRREEGALAGFGAQGALDFLRIRDGTETGFRLGLHFLR